MGTNLTSIPGIKEITLNSADVLILYSLPTGRVKFKRWQGTAKMPPYYGGFFRMSAKLQRSSISGEELGEIQAFEVTVPYFHPTFASSATDGLVGQLDSEDEGPSYVGVILPGLGYTTYVTPQVLYNPFTSYLTIEVTDGK